MGLINKKTSKKEPKVVRMKNGRFVKKEEYDKIIKESKEKQRLNKKKKIDDNKEKKNYIKQAKENKVFEKKEKIKEQEIKKEENEEEKRKRRMIIIILFLLLLFFLFILDIDDLILGIPSEPKVKIPKDKWYQTKVVKIEEDAKSRKKISHYLYCIRQDSNIEKCEWNRTDTKSIEVSKSGINHIWFKGVTEDGKEGKPSKEIIVKIDNEAPEEIKVKKTVTETTIKVKVEVKDKETKIEKYYYKIENEEYKESDKNEYTFKDLKPDTTYKITIKVVDSLGNEKEIILNIKTKKLKEETEEDTNLDKNDSQNNNQKDNNKENNQTSESIDNNGNKEENKKEDESKEEEIKEIPEIDLSGVPKKFEVGESYKLPTSYKFGKSGGVVSCTVDDKEYNDTKDLGIGLKQIKCSAKSNTGIEVRVEKEVEIVQKDIKETTWDGWITMNLYYPESSTDWQWRIGEEDATRDDGWIDYTGPITVRLTDVENVYIRYKLKSGEVVIVPPTGRLVVDIEPSSYTLKDGKKAKVKITYTKDADKKQYKINDGDWIDYTGEFSVGSDTRIEARVVKTTKEGTKKNYDSVYIRKYVEGQTGSTSSSTIKKGTRLPGEAAGTYETESNPSYGTNYKKNPSYTLNGPEIIKDTEEIVDSVKVAVKPQRKAKKIYYKEPGGKWTEYKDVVEVTKQGYFYAKYETEEGQTSSTSEIYIDNIDQHNLPNVKIGVNTILRAESVIVTMTTNGNNLRYSLDGEIYESYTGAIKLENNTRIYAQADNSNGTTTTYRDITNIGQIPTSISKEEYNIGIFLNPDKGDIKGLVNQTEASIVYDSRCVNKYYKIGYYGSYKTYTESVKITSNDTIYAYCTGQTGTGYEEKQINFLTTGIAAPKITLEPAEMAEEVKVEIEYPKTAKVKKYRIGTGELTDYTESITIDENTTIYAYTEDELKNSNSSERTITNITTLPRYTTLDMGSYFILKLNYPSSSDKETREYKWSSKGSFKKYNTNGILLIKNEYKDEIDTTDGVKVKDQNGKEILFTEDYYYVSNITNDISENLFMRWDYAIPKAPTIKLNTTTPTRKVEVTIEYTGSSKKQYKLVTKERKETEWLNYTGPITIDKNETVVYARGISDIEAVGKIGSKKITNIDEENPEVEAIGDFETPTRKLTIKIVGKDNLGINVVGWGQGKKDIKYFQDVASLQKNNSTFTVEENGIYTVYAEDMVGNTVIKKIEVENIDKTAPNIDINILTKEYGDTLEFEVDYHDSTKKEYKIGEKGTYKEYLGKVSVKANDILDQTNEDGSLTIYAKGTDKAGNVQEISEKTYIIDLDAPKVPIINTSTGYPILTEYGVEFDDTLSIKYDTRDDIENYISFDGKNWKIYTGVEHIQSGTVYAKSVKKVSGLTVTTNKKVDQPTNALGVEAYDGDESTSVTSGIIYVDKAMIGKYFSTSIKLSGSRNVQKFSFIDENNKTISTQNINCLSSSTNCINMTDKSLLIPEGTVKMILKTDWAKLNEIGPYNVPVINATDVYPTLTEYGVEKGISNITIDYSYTSVKKLYKIDDGEWKNYDGPIKLDANKTIYAKGIDKNGKETINVSKEIIIPKDALGVEAYDGDESTSVTSGIIYVDKAMIGKYFSTSIKLSGSRNVQKFSFIDENNKTISTQNINCLSSSTNCINMTDKSLLIPEGTVKMILKTDWAKLNEIGPYNVPVINATDVYPTLTEYGVEKGISNITIDYSYTSVKKLYKIDDGEWKNYDGPIKLDANKTIYAKGIDKNGKETINVSKEIIIPKDALGVEAYDGDESTSVTSGIIYVDKAMIGKYFSTSIKLSGSRNVQKFSFIDENNKTISTQNINCLSSSTNCINMTDKSLLIPEGTVKMILKTEFAKLNEIGPYNVPVINATDVYPILTEYGVEYESSNITIDYSYTSVKKLYKIDDGEWKNYDGPIKLTVGETIYAKGIDKNGKETPIPEYKSVLATDALGKEAYDGNNSTYTGVGGGSPSKYRKIHISPEMWGQNIEVLTSVYGSVAQLNEAKETLNSTNVSAGYGGKKTSKIQMVEGAKILEFRGGSSSNSLTVIEITICNQPIINVEAIYPELTKNRINDGYNYILINYFKTSMKKLYKIDDGEWQEYKDKKIKLNIGETIYAKGIDKNGKETPIPEYKSVLAIDALGKEAYDGNNSTYTGVGGGSSSGYRKIHISPEMWGQNIEVLTSVYGSVVQLNEAKEVLNSTNVSAGYGGKKTSKIQMVEGAKILEFRGGSSSNSLTVIEIYPSPTSTQSEQKKSKKMIVSDNNNKETITIPNFVDSPTINVSDANRYTSSKEITISYPSGGYENQYSLDGENWLNYTGSFTIDKETTVLARSMSNGNVISSSSYQITKIDNVKPTISLDDVPDEINLGDEYKLPTDYSFYNNKSGGSIKCLLNDTEEVNSTKDIIAGRHKIICSAITGSGIITTVEKNINVVDNSKQQEEKNDSNQDERPEESVKEGEVSEETKKIDEENKTEESSTNSN